jgi:HEAT repeat protein
LLGLFLALVLAVVAVAPGYAQGQVTGEEIEALLAALEGDDLLAAERASEELAGLGFAAAGAVPRLIEMFSTAPAPRPAAIALGGIGTGRAFQALTEALADDELTPRRNAAQIGLLHGDEAAVQALATSLQDGRAAKRRNAAELLGYFRSPLALNPLLRAANHDEDAGVRQEAVWSLSQIDSPRVRLALAVIRVNDPDAEVRAEAERALDQLNEGYR